MIHILKHRKGQTYEQIKLAKNRLFPFTCFNRLSPNSDQHQSSSDSQYPYKVKRLRFLELKKYHLKENALIFCQILSTYPFKEMYRDQFEELVRVKRVDPLLTRMQNALRLSK